MCPMHAARRAHITCRMCGTAHVAHVHTSKCMCRILQIMIYTCMQGILKHKASESRCHDSPIILFVVSNKSFSDTLKFGRSPDSWWYLFHLPIAIATIDGSSQRRQFTTQIGSIDCLGNHGTSTLAVLLQSLL